jgi:protoporphyrinogen oxidase
MEDRRLIRAVRSHLTRIGWLSENEIESAAVHRMHYAYPVLEVGFEKKIKKIFGYLDRFENLKLSGRNGKFQYSHVHDMMMFARDIVAGYRKR